jgi:transposase-like protein
MVWIVEATLAPGASVARVSREFAVNANQDFAWRRAYKQGLLEGRGSSGVAQLPVRIAVRPHLLNPEPLKLLLMMVTS